MTNRRQYALRIEFNGQEFSEVIIDPHYEEKHASSITDMLILLLVSLLDGNVIPPDSERGFFRYYATDRITSDGRVYRLVWLTEKDKSYIGVINAYRRS